MIVIKYGGHALPEPGSVDPVLELIAQEFRAGRKLVLTHGGGPQINAALSQAGLVKEMVGGYRKTTPEVFEIVQEVLSGKVLRTIVNQLIALGVDAVGLSAADGSMIRAKQMSVTVDGLSTDIGLVGDIDVTDPTLLTLLLSAGKLPVISPIGVSTDGQGLNLNADLVAGALGGALQAECVLFMTDVSGIYRNWPDQSSLIEEISAAELTSIAPSFAQGMAPKVKAALAALSHGAQTVRIFDGRTGENLRLAFAGKGGTLVTL
jgi:acetylglutamate kinase